MRSGEKLSVRGSDLDVLQSQVLSGAASISAELWPASSNHGEDTQNAFHRHIYVNIHVCAADREIKG